MLSIKTYINKYSFALCLGVLVFTFAISYFVSAWTEPAMAPPGGNVDTPLNVGNYSQTKQGNLVLNQSGFSPNALIINGNIIILPQSVPALDGKVGIGIMNPTSRLDVNGKIHATDDICTDLSGGKCLSNIPGPGGQWSISGNNIYYNSGNVGIGTANPQEALDVQGNIEFGSENIKLTYKTGSNPTCNKGMLARRWAQQTFMCYESGGGPLSGSCITQAGWVSIPPTCSCCVYNWQGYLEQPCVTETATQWDAVVCLD